MGEKLHGKMMEAMGDDDVEKWRRPKEHPRRHWCEAKHSQMQDKQCSGLHYVPPSHVYSQKAQLHYAPGSCCRPPSLKPRSIHQAVEIAHG